MTQIQLGRVENFSFQSFRGGGELHLHGGGQNPKEAPVIGGVNTNITTYMY